MVADPPCPMNDTLKLCAVVPEIITACDAPCPIAPCEGICVRPEVSLLLADDQYSVDLPVSVNVRVEEVPLYLNVMTTNA